MGLPNSKPNSKGSILKYEDLSTVLEFQYNPTTIKERRGAIYNFSEAQGQILPQAQYGRVDNTQISFELLLHEYKGFDLVTLRSLTLPKQLTNLTYYSQAQPNIYVLNLGEYGALIGVVSSVDITTEQYHKATLAPVLVRAQIKFTQVSAGAVADLSTLSGLILDR